jgi:hypothetical protein
VRNGYRDSVRNEQVNSSVCGSYKELSDLESGKSSLDNVRNAVAECGDGVVGVLKLVSHIMRSKSRNYSPSWREYQS